MKTWKNCTYGSFEALQEIGDGGPSLFVWPDEGHFTATGAFQFDEEHHACEPTGLSKDAAKAVLLLHSACRADINRQLAIERKLLKSRTTFFQVWQITEEFITKAGLGYTWNSRPDNN